MQKFLIALTAILLGVSALAQEKSQPNLIATYTDATHRVVTLAATLNFSLKDIESIHPQLAPAFTAQWDGVLKIVKRAKYTLTADGAPDARLQLDGKDVAAKAVELDVGDHPLHMEYARKPGAARLQLMWVADFFTSEPVPSAALGHRQTPPQAEESDFFISPTFPPG